MFENIYKEECNLFGECLEQNFELKKAFYVKLKLNIFFLFIFKKKK